MVCTISVKVAFTVVREPYTAQLNITREWPHFDYEDSYNKMYIHHQYGTSDQRQKTSFCLAIWLLNVLPPSVWEFWSHERAKTSHFASTISMGLLITWGRADHYISLPPSVWEFWSHGDEPNVTFRFHHHYEISDHIKEPRPLHVRLHPSVWDFLSQSPMQTLAQ